MEPWSTPYGLVEEAKLKHLKDSIHYQLNKCLFVDGSNHDPYVGPCFDYIMYDELED